MSDDGFRAKRRQLYLNEESYLNTLAHLSTERKPVKDYLKKNLLTPRARATNLSLLTDLWEEFQLHYTAGEDLSVLAASLTDIVSAYEAYREAWDASPDGEHYPAFRFEDMIDHYVDYINLLSAAICLHREDLIPRIYGLIEGGAYDGTDLVIEDLLTPFLPNRPDIDEWFWDKPYGQLLHAKYEDSPDAQAKGMKKYVKAWYPGMKGQAHFWGGHEYIKPEFTPYNGYWAMCSAAFSYLYDIDDSSYRDEIVYPKDLADYARSKPRRTPEEAAGLLQKVRLCVEGGQACPRTGYWFTPAQTDSRRHFKQGDVMPVFDGSQYGATIWQWSDEQSAA